MTMRVNCLIYYYCVCMQGQWRCCTLPACHVCREPPFPLAGPGGLQGQSLPSHRAHLQVLSDIQILHISINTRDLVNFHNIHLIIVLFVHFIAIYTLFYVRVKSPAVSNRVESKFENNRPAKYVCTIYTFVRGRFRGVADDIYLYLFFGVIYLI